MFCYQKNMFNPTKPVDEAQFYALVRASQWKENIDKYRETGNAALKRALPAFIFQATFDQSVSKGGRKGAWRKQAAARLTGLVVMDVDHIEKPHDVFRNVIEKECAKAENGILLVYVTPSGHGLKIVFKAHAEWGNLIDNQHQMARLLGVEVDESCKDASRMSFICKEEDILFIDRQLFTYQDKAFAGQYEQTYRQGDSQATSPAPAEQPAPAPVEQPAPARQEEQTKAAPRETERLYHGIPYARIVEAWLGGKTVGQGDRHRTSLLLADHLRYITDNDAALIEHILRQTPFVQEIIRERNENVAQTVKSAQAYDFYRNIPKRMAEALKAAGAAEESGQPETDSGEDSTPLAPEAPRMPDKLPRLISLLTSRTPQMYKAAVAHALFPPLATHLCDVRFTYTDNVEHEATLMNCLMAGTGAGKGCIDEPIARIMADIRERDRENERREAEWKKDCQKKGANKDKQPRPKGLVIQIIDPDMTKPALVTRMDEAEGHFVYVKLNELDLFEQLRGPNGKQHFQLMCLAFDPGAEYGQTRVGTGSVTARPRCRFNWNACTTLLKGRRFFRNVLTDGPLSRINFCTIPEQEIGGEQPVYGRYDKAFDQELKPYIDNLCSAHGLIECPQAYALAQQLQQECAEFARLSQNEVYWNLSHRACVIAWLKACVLYTANGQQWEETIGEFVRWSLNYDLWCKMQFFGADIEKANSGEDARIGSHGPKNLLALLPDTFTLEDARRVRQQQGMDKEKAGNMVSTWKKRHYVVQMADGSFQKSDRFRKELTGG